MIQGTFSLFFAFFFAVSLPFLAQCRKTVSLQKKTVPKKIHFDLSYVPIRNTYDVEINLEIKIQISSFPTGSKTHLYVEIDRKGDKKFSPLQRLFLKKSKGNFQSTLRTNLSFDSPQNRKIGFRIKTDSQIIAQKYLDLKIPLLDPSFTGNYAGKAVYTKRLLLTWEKVDFAQKYLVQIASDRNFDNILIREVVLQPQYPIPFDLEKNKHYCVRIKPLHDLFPSQFAPFIGFARVDIPAVKIPGSSFMMGRLPAFRDRGTLDEEPIHKVFVDTFYIDIYEVRIADYALFLNTLNPPACYVKEMADSQTMGIVFTNHGFHVIPGRENYPAVYVNYDDATAFAKWRGMRLPTEAEWELAAKGQSYRDFPFDPAYSFRAPIGKEKKKTVPVDSFPEGKSEYGLYHVSGNVWEWVYDYYWPTFYEDAGQSKNPKGPEKGYKGYRTLRGGSVGYERWKSRVVYRDMNPPKAKSAFLGFRCASSLPP